MVESGSLMISEVYSSDAGKYECTAQSMAGSKSSPPAILSVLAPPTVVRGPQDTEVVEGEGLDLPCELTGDPKPTVSWHRENGNLPETRSRILLDNTLRIEDARPEDQGRYICKGHNEGGNVSVAVKLYVYAIPTFIEAPADAEAHEGTTLRLPCRAQGRPKARIVWDRVGARVDASQLLELDTTQDELLARAKIMSLRSKRERLHPNATLAPESSPAPRTRRDTSGNLAGDRVLEAEFLQIMRDQEDDDLQDDPPTWLRTFDLSSKRVKRSEGEEEVEDSPEDGTSDATSVLFFSTPLPSDVSRLEVDENGELILRDVTQHHQGWYACAALNEAGSVVKRVFVRILAPGVAEGQSPQPLEPVSSRWGTDQTVLVSSVRVIPPPATVLTLHYRPAADGGDFVTSSAPLSAKRHRIDDLRAHTEYEVFATVPGGLGGSISNIRTGMTLDGAPSAPPTDVRVGVINTTAAYVRWSPPPQHLLNGELTGYNIQIKSNTTNKILGQMSLNASTQSVVINSLIPGGRYIASVASLTAGGLGPYSPPAALHMDPSYIPRPPRTDPAANGWSSMWMSGIVLGILGVGLSGGAIFALYWAKRNKRIMKASYPGPMLTATLPDKQHTLWLHGNPMIKPTHSLAPPAASEYAEVTPTNHLQKPPLPNSAPPEPYATVTLQRGTSGASDDTCAKCSASPSSSEYNAPLREPMNLCEMLPPPPDHPYGAYKPPNNMTIRTNPTAMSPQVMRRVPPTPPRWGTLPPPIPSFPQTWCQRRPDGPGSGDFFPEENDYESGSVLYEQCCRPEDQNYFHGIEPTEEYYRNVNMEFFEDQEFEPSTPPPPCPSDAYASKISANMRLIANGSVVEAGQLKRPQPRSHQGSTTQSAHSSDDESESDNRWAPRSRRSRSRSKSGDRKYRNGGHIR
uniref:Neural cell adhesion molecule l1 n=2 Tax=Lutzomyia longipalpis TaxID=7200 RepID=A0A1B0CVQ8_LUTLO